MNIKKSAGSFFIFLAFSSVILLSCDNDKNPPVIDINPPVITVLGANPYTHCIIQTADTVIYLPYADPGATAFDEEDGDITHKITTEVDVDIEQEGAYTVTYTVEDEAGNTATAARVVNVMYCK